MSGESWLEQNNEVSFIVKGALQTFIYHLCIKIWPILPEEPRKVYYSTHSIQNNLFKAYIKIEIKSVQAVQWFSIYNFGNVLNEKKKYENSRF